MTAIATCHISRKAKIAGLSENMTYGDLINDLSSAWRMVSVPYPPKRGNQGRNKTAKVNGLRHIGSGVYFASC